MHKMRLRGLLSICLAGALLLSVWAFPVKANEMPAAEPPSTTGAAAEPAPTTQPPTEPAPTTQPPTEPAPTTQPPTEPAPTTQPTVPASTSSPELSRMTIRGAKEQSPGTEGIVVKGTIVFADYGLTVIQDNTGGISLTLGTDLGVTAGEVVQVVGSRTADGLAVESLERHGTAELPTREATLDAMESYTHVTVKNVTFNAGYLIRNAQSIPMVPANPEGIDRGEKVNVWGVFTGSVFYADRVLSAEPKQDTLPALTATPGDSVLLPGENIGLHCSVEGVSIYYCLSEDGEQFGEYHLYSGGIPVEDGVNALHVRAYARKEGYADSPETEFYFSRQGSGAEEVSWNHYFGQLHAHTSLSDGTGSVEEAFAYASQVPGLDFFAVTDHSDSFDHALEGKIGQDGTAVSQKWAAGKAAAAAVTDGDFVGIFGYEMSWQDRNKGHINTFHTPGWQAWGQSEFVELEAYYQALTTVPGSISQFNHPGAEYGSFDGFRHYDPQYDACIQLLEVGSEFGQEAYDAYTRALDAGWHVAPTNNQANHSGGWGTVSDVRTVVLASALTEEALFQAIRSRRVYATQDKDLEIWYDLNGSVMGSVIREPAGLVTVKLQDATDPAPATVEVIVSDGEVVGRGQVASGGSLMLSVPEGYAYYYVKVTQDDGDVAVTAPVWTDTTVDVGFASIQAVPETPRQGLPVTLTLNVENREQQDFLLEKLEVYLGDSLIYTAGDTKRVAAGNTLSCSLPLTYNGLGTVQIKAVASGSLDGAAHSFESTLSLQYLPSQEDTALSAISYVRSGTAGQVYRVEGYVTAGNSDPRNTFRDMICLQDDTGGIGVTGFPAEEIVSVGMPLTVRGYLEDRQGNPTLVYVDHEVRAVDGYRYVPKTMYHSTAMDYGVYGGQLLQVEGQVMSLTRTADGKGISRLVLKDIRGDLATVRIDDNIVSSASGVNDLTKDIKAGVTVRAMGILYLEADGTAVLRVRNCDEVVSVAPVADPSNPKTGDPWTCISG